MPSVLTKARPISDIEAYIKWLLYGSKGAGKTYLAGRAPKPIFFDFERSTETLRYSKETANVPVLQAGVDFTTAEEVIETVKAAIKSNYETLVFDTATRMQIFQMQEYMLNIEAADKKKHGDKSTRTHYLPYKGDFRYSTELLDELFMILQQAPVHVIFTAHARNVYKEKSDQTLELVGIIPDLTPALSGRLTGLVNVVGYLESSPDVVGKQKRKLYVNPGFIIEAKNRLGIQELFLDNPTFATLTERKLENA